MHLNQIKKILFILMVVLGFTTSLSANTLTQRIDRYECVSANYKLILIHWPELGMGVDSIPFIDYEVNGKGLQSFRYVLQENNLKLLAKELHIEVSVAAVNSRGENIEERRFILRTTYEYTDKKSGKVHFVGTIEQESKWSKAVQKVECVKHSTY